MLQEGWNIVRTAVEWYFSNGYVWILLLCALIFALFRRKDKNYYILGWYTVIYAVLVLNPISALILGKLGLDGVYWRTLWMIPTGGMIAYTFTQLVSLKKLRMFRPLLIVVCSIVIVLSGKLIYNSNNFQLAENPYKIPQEVIEVSEYIEPGNAVLAPLDVMIWLRTYDADIYLPIGRQSYFFEGNEEKNSLIQSLSDPAVTDVEYIASNAMRYGCRYIVIENNREMDGQWEDFGYELVGQTERYIIYCR